MHNGLEMDYEALCEEAARVVAESNYSQTKLADELEVSTGAMSRALSESGPKFSRLQRRILERLTPYRIKEHVVFRAESHD